MYRRRVDEQMPEHLRKLLNNLSYADVVLAKEPIKSLAERSSRLFRRISSDECGHLWIPS